MDCATRVHVIRNGGYINGLVRGLTAESRVMSRERERETRAYAN